MALVTYSDSEGSDDEQGVETVQEVIEEPVASAATSKLTINKTQPNKIKVNLQRRIDPSLDGSHEDEPAIKRQRVGAGVFSGFNSMLPAPKRDNIHATQNGGSKPSSRKIFGLKTGAEAAFSRESDAELRNFFAEQEDELEGVSRENTTTPTMLPKPVFAKPPDPVAGANPFMFKPLSVARNQKKKKPVNGVLKASGPAQTQTLSESAASSNQLEPAVVELPRKKISLFSTGADAIPNLPLPEDQEIAGDEHDMLSTHNPIDELPSEDFIARQQYAQPDETASQSLDTIASDLNLSRAERRQLFGRNNVFSGTQALNIVNFNTDAEYAANQQLIAAGETVQHNPVRGIAPGKHSLKQLVNAASVQKEALEESFAQGRRNKKEAGNKYGW